MFAFGMSQEEYEAHMEEHRLNREASNHDLHDWLDSLDQQGLEVFRKVMYDFAEQPSAAFLVGTVTSLLATKFNICRGCGKNHDDLDPSVLLKPTVPQEDVKASGGHIQKMPTEPITDWSSQLEKGDEIAKAVKSFEEMSGEELLANVPKAEQDQMDEYGLDFIEFQYPKVKCHNCGLEYVSMKDRAVKDPGVKGCGGCQEKAKWG